MAQRVSIFKAPHDEERSNNSKSAMSERNFDSLSQPDDTEEEQILQSEENNITYQMDTEEPTMLDMELAEINRNKLLGDKRSNTASAA